MTLRRALTRKRFTAWLKAMEPRQVAGRANMFCECPIARWSDTNTNEVKFPMWANRFMVEVDHSRYFGQPVTAATCLRILEGIK